MSQSEEPTAPLVKHVLFPLFWAEVVIGVLLLGAIGFYLSEALALPSSLNPSDVGAGRFPTIAGGVAFAATVVMLIGAFLRRKRTQPDDRVYVGRPLWVLICAGLLVGQAELFEVLGAVPVILISSVLIMLTCGERRPLHLILTPIAMTVVIYSLFTYALGIQLP